VGDVKESCNEMWSRMCGIERGKRGFDCDKQNVEGSGSSPQSRAKGSEERITEGDNRKD